MPEDFDGLAGDLNADTERVLILLLLDMSKESLQKFLDATKSTNIDDIRKLDDDGFRVLRLIAAQWCGNIMIKADKLRTSQEKPD